MTTLDTGMTALRTSVTALRSFAGHCYEFYERASVTLKSVMPKGLFARALLIIIAPMVLLQSVVAFMFMERHYNLVTQRLSAGVVQDIASLIEVYRVVPQDTNHTQLRRIAQEKLGLVVDFLPVNDLPPPGPKPFSPWWIRRSRRRSATASVGRSGSTPSGAPHCLKSASGSTMR